MEKVSSTDLLGPLQTSRSSDWLPEKLRLCGEVVGLSVSNCDKGWESLIEFAEGRQRQNKDLSGLDKSKRKGSRELQGLLGSIN